MKFNRLFTFVLFLMITYIAIIKMWPVIYKEEGMMLSYTDHCLCSIMVQKLSDADLEAREIMSVRGHICESFLQNFGLPELSVQRRWSSILAMSRNASPNKISKPKVIAM